MAEARPPTALLVIHVLIKAACFIPAIQNLTYLRTKGCIYFLSVAHMALNGATLSELFLHVFHLW
jgi:hypothetical protein